MIARLVLIVCCSLMSPFLLMAQSKSSFTLTGQVEGFADGSEVKLIRSGENTPLTTGRINSNQFVLKGELAEPSLVFLLLGDQSQPVELFMENTDMVLRGRKGEPGSMQLEGSGAHRIFTQFVAGFVPFVQLRNQQATALNAPGAEKQRDSLMAAYTATSTGMQQFIEQMVAQQPGSPVTAFVLAATFGFFNDMAWLERNVSLLQSSARESASGKQLEAMIQDGKIGAVGSKAMDFTQADTAARWFHYPLSGANMCWSIFGPVGVVPAVRKTPMWSVIFKSSRVRILRYWGYRSIARTSVTNGSKPLRKIN